MYLLICQTLEIRLVHYPFINQGTHSFSGRGIKFLLKTTNHYSEGEPLRGLLPLPLNTCTQIFRNDCQSFLTLVLPSVGIGIPIYASDFKECHFLNTFHLPCGFQLSFIHQFSLCDFFSPDSLPQCLQMICFHSFLCFLSRPQVAISS